MIYEVLLTGLKPARVLGMKASPNRMGRPTLLPPKPASFLLRLPPDLLQDLRAYAGSRGRSANEVIWKALAAFCNEPVQVRDAIVALPAATTGKNSVEKTGGSRKSRR